MDAQTPHPSPRMADSCHGVTIGLVAAGVAALTAAFGLTVERGSPLSALHFPRFSWNDTGEGGLVLAVAIVLSLWISSVAIRHRSGRGLLGGIVGIIITLIAIRSLLTGLE